VYPTIDLSLTDEKRRLLDEYASMLLSVNRKFNLISRSDIQQVKTHHVGHCLAYGLNTFPKDCHIVDWGSGGGLPAIPIAILWPEAHVTAVDSNAKKTRSIDLFCRRLGISNCSTWQGRAHEWPGKLDYSVSRATAPLKDLWGWHERSSNEGTAGETEWSPGLICLKGGDMKAEIDHLHREHPSCEVETISLKEYFNDAYFETKSIVHVHL